MDVCLIEGTNAPDEDVTPASLPRARWPPPDASGDSWVSCSGAEAYSVVNEIISHKVNG